MKLAIMQPYFFPYIGYFQIMKMVDQWVIFDNVQFVNKGWVNRNRILHPDIQKEWQYITIPLANKNRFSNINAIEMHPIKDWQDELLGKLTVYRKKAPFYKQTVQLVTECLEFDSSNLSMFLGHSLKKIAGVLGIDTPIHFIEDLGISVDSVTHPGQWAVKISAGLKAQEYINPPAGYKIFKEDEFVDHGIKLSYLKSKLTPYNQCVPEFIPGLSIIDIMMWNDMEKIQTMLESDFNLLSHEDLFNEGK